MADLFDVSVGGVGFHFTSHLIALAALFIACFAIAGYITFRENSIPGDALKDAEGLADEDIHAVSLTTTGDVTVGGALTVSGMRELVTTKHSLGGFGGQGIVATIDSNTGAGYNFDQCEKLFNFLSTKDSLTAAEITTLFGTTATSASVSSTITALAAGDVANNGMDINLGVQFLTGAFGNEAKDIGANNSFVDNGDNSQNLVVFGDDVVSSGTDVLTLTLTGNAVDSSGASIAFTGADNNVFTIAAARLGDTNENIVLTPGNGTVIKKGSFLYIENVGGAGFCIIRGYLKIGDTALTSATC